MKENNLFYMQKAYKESLIAFLNNSVPVGSVFTNKKNFESCAHNIGNKYSKGQHAEIVCIDNLSFKKNSGEFYLYTTLIPCPMCSGYIYMKDIDNIYIGTNSNNDLYNKNFNLLLRNRCKNYYIKNKCSHVVSLFFKKMR